MSDGRSEHMNAGPLTQLPEGFPFTADSPIRRYTEPAGIFLMPAIAGFSIMDDQIAAGVRAHSEFTTKPVSRLIGTGQSALKLVFGNEEEAFSEAEKLHRFHATTVHGVDGQARISYEANDSRQQAWVLACVTKGIEETNRRWTHRGAIDREGLWRDVRTFGRFFGIQPELLPEEVAGLDAYWEQRLSDHSLLRTGASRQMAFQTFRFRGGSLPRPIIRIGQAVWITSLDPRLQERANITPNKTDLRISHAVDAMMRVTYANIPNAGRESVIPLYLSAGRRLHGLGDRTKSARV